jgi:hypothetical protein
MAKDIFQKRGMYLEEEYFRKKEFELLEKLKAVFQKKVDKESIRKATGVTNEQVLVEIAWADGDLSESEARSVLAAGEKQGIRPGTRPYRMLEDRLHKGPDPELRKIWFLYAEELKKTLTRDELKTFRNDLLERARGIVAATGHLERLLIDVGGERKVLAAIEKALTP